MKNKKINYEAMADLFAFTVTGLIVLIAISFIL